MFFALFQKNTGASIHFSLYLKWIGRTYPTYNNNLEWNVKNSLFTRFVIHDHYVEKWLGPSYEELGCQV